MQSLCGSWKLAMDNGNVGREEKWFTSTRPDAVDVPVPGIIQQAVPGAFGVAWYWTTFTPLRAAGDHERVLLKFGAVDYLAEVWVNGKSCGERLWGPHVFDVSDALRPGANEIRVRVANLINNSYGEFAESGLLGPVRLIRDGRP